MEEMGMSQRRALDAIRSWPAQSRDPASWILHVHGEPDHCGSTELVWTDVGPWKRVVATRSYVERESPTPHTASVRSFIDYRVPVERRSAVHELSGGLEFDPTTDEVSACGHDLQANLLAINLLDEVVADALSIDEARRRYAGGFLDALQGHPTADQTEFHPGGGGPTGEPTPVPTRDELQDGHDPIHEHQGPTVPRGKTNGWSRGTGQ